MLRCVAFVRATRRNIPEDTILHSHRRENLKSYNVILVSSTLQNVEIEPLSTKTRKSLHKTKDFKWKQSPRMTERASELAVQMSLLVALVIKWIWDSEHFWATANSTTAKAAGKAMGK
jgi:hypothetical protein